MAELREEKRPQQSSKARSDIEKPQRTEREPTIGGSIARRQHDPFWMMNDLHREMDRLFDNFGFPTIFERQIDRGAWSPQVEMYERDGKLVVHADLPGLNKDDIKVELNDNVLSIEGERKSERHDEQGGWSERSYGQFFRSIALPEGINAENANATFNNGVLEITIDAPQRNQPRGRKIEVK